MSDVYPDPPPPQWVMTYPIRNKDLIRRMELALHNESQVPRRFAIIQSFLDEFDAQMRATRIDLRRAGKGAKKSSISPSRIKRKRTSMRARRK